MDSQGRGPEVLVLYQKRPQRRKLVASSESAAVAFDTTLGLMALNNFRFARGSGTVAGQESTSAKINLAGLGRDRFELHAMQAFGHGF